MLFSHSHKSQTSRSHAKQWFKRWKFCHDPSSYCKVITFLAPAWGWLNFNFWVNYSITFFCTQQIFYSVAGHKKNLAQRSSVIIWSWFIVYHHMVIKCCVTPVTVSMAGFLDKQPHINKLFESVAHTLNTSSCITLLPNRKLTSPPHSALRQSEWVERHRLSQTDDTAVRRR